MKLFFVGTYRKSIESILLQLQLHWAGHVARMEDTRSPKAVIFGELKKLESATEVPQRSASTTNLRVNLA